MSGKIKVQKDIEPPMGYSFIGMWNNEAGAQRWYAAAMKAKDQKPYMLTLNRGMYTLWVKKTKGEGKMVGRGYGLK